MSKPTITIEDIIAYHEAEARLCEANAKLYEQCGLYRPQAETRYDLAAAHREAAALLRKGLDE